MPSKETATRNPAKDSAAKAPKAPKAPPKAPKAPPKAPKAPKAPPKAHAKMTSADPYKDLSPLERAQRYASDRKTRGKGMVMGGDPDRYYYWFTPKGKTALELAGQRTDLHRRGLEPVPEGSGVYVVNVPTAEVWSYDQETKDHWHKERFKRALANDTWVELQRNRHSAVTSAIDPDMLDAVHSDLSRDPRYQTRKTKKPGADRRSDAR